MSIYGKVVVVVLVVVDVVDDVWNLFASGGLDGNVDKNDIATWHVISTELPNL